MTANPPEVTTNLDKGLAPDEVRERLDTYGYNEIPEKSENRALLFARKFWGITPWMLEVTMILTWFLGHYFEFYMITGLLFFNAILGFIQDERANRAIDYLKQKLSIESKVRRNGEWTVIPAREMVPGDVVRLRAGDFVPADVKVATGNADIDQSSLTGESLTVEATASGDLLAGSIVRRGEVTGIVASTGMKTYFGRSMELIQIARPKLHMEEVTSRVVRWLLVMVACLLAVGLAVAAVRGIGIVDILPLAAILLVSAIPVALPTLFTITMALGASELAGKGVLVTRLSATEDAATMDTLCVDKTGTLTLNRLSVIDSVAADGFKKEHVLLYGALASQEANQDPIDQAFLSAVKNAPVSLDDYVQEEFVPFDASTRRTEARIRRQGERFVVFKGAVNTIVPLCRNSGEVAAGLEKDVTGFSSKGYRTTAIAMGTTADSMNLVGIAALYDQPRPDSAKLIGDLTTYGVSVKMLTGDALPVAAEVAHELGLGHSIVPMARLNDRGKGIADLKTIEQSGGFAEVYPEDKYSIVKSLQTGGHVIGMTGDGVNDAPALKQAEVGIATSNAVDVAKSASSVVLTTEGLQGIVELVKTGRTTYQRIVTWVLNKIVKTFLIVAFVVLGFLMTGEYVVSIFSMVLILFLTDFVTLSISTDNVRFSMKPDTWDIAALARVAILLGIMMVAEALLLLYVGYYHLGYRENVNELYTFVFAFIVFASLFNLLVVRERGRFWGSIPSRVLVLSMVGDVAAVFLISIFGLHGLDPINPLITLAVFAYALVTSFAVNDLVKVLLAERLWPRGPDDLRRTSH